MGKAAGVDGILSSVIRHAADAVGTNKLKPENSVVDALVLMFNYVFYREEWPERWGSGHSTNRTAGWSQATIGP